MTAYVFGVVGLRIVAVYIAAEILYQVMYTYSFLLRGPSEAADFVPWAAYSLCAFFGMALWMLAPRLSEKATRGLQQAEEVKSEWTARNVQRVAISLMGVWFIVQALPSLVVQQLAYMRLSDEVEDASRLLEGLAPDGVQIVLGLLLLLGASFWSDLLVRIQEFGLSRKTRA